MNASDENRSLGQSLLWGAFLASSWTWCIGMWLPVILIRDFGWMSFLVFAIPNVVGAALMGYALRADGLAERVVRQHALAVRGFSFVTIAFQWFFILWMFFGTTGTAGTLTIAGGAIAGSVLAGFARRRGGRASLGGLLALVVSLVTVCVALLQDSSTVLELPQPLLNTPALLALAPVCVLGFMLCPYLDGTFHAARASLGGRAGTRAFVIGFGVFFLAMIVLTLLYAGPALSAAQGSTTGLSGVAPALLALPIVLHVALQAGFTAQLHRMVEGEIKGEQSPAAASLRHIGALGVGLVLAAMATRAPGYADLSATEIVYRLFMSFYGLVFPAYVWVCMLPLGASGPSRRSLAVWIAAVALAGPCYWLGFIERESWWLAPGVMIVLLARLAVLRGGSAKA